MYRLCRLFISEVTAGENLLCNGFVPILRENGHADHGVLFAANGTCKTTVLSFILSVFCPDQRRFVQHLQSSGDKTLDQYLIPGRPAVVLLDIASLAQPSLFEAEPEEHLVLGQLLYRHRSARDKVDRIFFLAQSLDFFDRLRRNWEALLGREQPWRAVRDFMTPHIQHTTSQKEWSDSLERLGLDPWLIDRQIDFARSEGGIKDAFKFRSEEEFLNFFLGCVTDMDAAVTLRSTIAKSLSKMKDRPRKIAQLSAARDLKARIVDFDGMARLWRDTQESVQSSLVNLGEAAHLMKQANDAADRKMKNLQTSLDEAEGQRQESFTRREIARVNASAVERFQLQQQIAQAQKEITEAKQEIEGLRREANALKSADVIADIRRNRAEEETKRDALLQAGQELTPMLRRVDGLALQYHLRLDGDRQRVQEEIEALKTQIAALESSLKTAEEGQADLALQREALEEKMLQNTARILAAEERRKTLAMQPGEAPKDARNRLLEEIRTMEERITVARGRGAALDEELRAGNSRWKRLQEQQSEARAGQKSARERMDGEARQREKLLACPHLRRVAGTAAFEPTTAELVSRLDSTIVRSRERLAKKEHHRFNLEKELERLAGIETLAADDQTRQLIAHYHAQGVSPGELKSFPEYLAGLYTSPEEIAGFMEGDPGRFSGIMAATEVVIEAVQELPVPEWLQRPVVLSTPIAPDTLSPIAQAVIRPRDPKVYSKKHLEETRARLGEQMDALETELGEQTVELKEMETTSRDLHAYREKFPDAAAVTALADRVGKLDRTLATLAAQIHDAEALFETLGQRKAEQERSIQSLTAEVTRLDERMKHVETWLRQYEPLEAWKRDAEEMIFAKDELAARIDAQRDALKRIREDIAGLRGDIGERRILLKGLDERAGDVPKPEDAPFSDADRQAALAMDLQTLRGLFEDARESQRRKAGELGIDALQKELDTLQASLSRQEASLDTLRREYPHEEALADRWAAQSVVNREERRAALTLSIEERTGIAGGLRSRIDYQNREIKRLNTDLSERARKGVRPDILEEDLGDQDLDALIHRLKREEARHAETHERLRQRCRELLASLKVHERWHQETRLGLAETLTFAPVWDKHSPRSPWPDLLATSTVEETIASVRALREQIGQRIAIREEELKARETARRRMSGGFDRLQADLQGESLRGHLPAVIDELRRHDTESLGVQAEELIQRCEEIARNIESDLEISQRIVDNLVEMLLSRAKEYHQKLQAAAQETLPEDVFIYGGQSILRAGTRLDFTRYGEDFRRSVENWLHELIQQDRLPEANPRAGNCLGAELLYQLLGASTGKKAFGIRLLKCDDTGRNYEPVGKDLGSGGEALTTAVLLYTLLISMRKKRHSQPDGRIPAFLVLDNPLGVCNRSDFLDTQLKVARAMGIQCVYLTGINDRESLDLFELRVAIRKGEKKLEIDRTTYSLLEITELNVERGHGQVPA